jgi:hypothetical protein
MGKVMRHLAACFVLAASSAYAGQAAVSRSSAAITTVNGVELPFTYAGPPLEPSSGSPATERTEIWIGFDDENVYIGVHAWDTHPERMIATDMRRDNAQVWSSESRRTGHDATRRAGPAEPGPRHQSKPPVPVLTRVQ